MPTLLELQHAVRRSLVGYDDGAAAALLSDGVAHDRLDIYRNTIILGLTKALRLCYPVVQRLVGADFFDDAARRFIAEHPPRSAYLDQFGSEFPEFLRRFPPAASLAYLADVARLEWAVNCAIHAPDVEPIELAKLAAIESSDQSRVSFVAHPSVRVLRADYPVDHIVDAGSVYLLVERRTTGVEVVRLDEPAWRFIAQLCAGAPIQSAVDWAADFDFSTALAEHLAVGRFVAFELAAREAMPSWHEVVA